MGKLGGLAFIKVNGVQIPSLPGAKLMMGTPARSEVLGDSGVLGFTEKTVAPGIECTITLRSDMSITDITDYSGSVTFETNHGKVFILRNAWVKNSLEYTANDNSEIPLQFGGMSCEEIK